MSPHKRKRNRGAETIDLLHRLVRQLTDKGTDSLYKSL